MPHSFRGGPYLLTDSRSLLKQLEMLHAAVERVQRPQVVDLIHNLYELSLSVSAAAFAKRDCDH